MQNPENRSRQPGEIILDQLPRGQQPELSRLLDGIGGRISDGFAGLKEEARDTRSALMLQLDVGRSAWLTGYFSGIICVLVLWALVSRISHSLRAKG